MSPLNGNAIPSLPVTVTVAAGEGDGFGVEPQETMTTDGEDERSTALERTDVDGVMDDDGDAAGVTAALPFALILSMLTLIALSVGVPD